MDSSSFALNSRAYDVLKWVALVLLPAFGTLYFGLGQLWHFPAVEEVVGSVVVLDTFLGMLINKSSKNNAQNNIVGDLIVQQDAEGLAAGMRLVANRDPLILDDQTQVIFKVKREQSL